MTTTLLAAAAGAGLGGCETDSFLDPSTLGRWENTPTVMPILDRLSTIEDEPSDMVRSEPIQPQDLIPEIEQYRFGPGDVLEIIIRDFTIPGAEERFEPNIDSRGYAYIPRLEPLRAQGRTNTELVRDIQQAVQRAGIRDDADAIVAVNILSQRSQTFSVLGAAAAQQEYFIAQPNYRLLQALTAAGGFNETVEMIYVIRQVGLSDEAAGVMPPGPMAAPERPAGEPVPPPADPDKLLDLINELSKPREGAPPPPQPGMIRPRNSRRGQPDPVVPPSAPVPAPAGEPPPPAIDLPEPEGPDSAPPGEPRRQSDWVYENGQWVKRRGAAAGTAGGANAPVVTQRVIQIPVSQLLAGDASVNIVIRPGDVIRVPPPVTGVVYLGGQVSRPGPYTLSGDTRLTILRGMISAGGLGTIAIPERVDITRVVGAGRQATIRLNLRAIGEQTQPDIYLKPDDMINVGTNFWALPLAVIRGGFRASYGYGFILDRNFSGDVFGSDQSLNNNN